MNLRDDADLGVDPAPLVGSVAAVPIAVRDLVVSFGEHRAVDGVSFDVEPGEQIAILGPSGCGKTTLLRCIAGLETPTSGEILVGGEPVFSSERGVDVPVEDRGLSLMFQSYAVWPHMTVSQNVGYALRLRRVPRADRARRVRSLLELVGLAEYANAPATRLSGGQQQRVALARSYAHQPRALLLDEPLSNLDARLREQVRDDLVAFQRRVRVTTVSVTHDQEEAMAISDRIVVMDRGRVVQVGTPEDVYHRPSDEFVADFVGAANVLRGELRLGQSGHPVLRVGEADVVCTAPDGWTPEPGPAAAAVRTVHPRLTRTAEELGGSDGNVWPATIARRTFLGDAVQLVVDWPGSSKLRYRGPSILDLGEGEAAFVQLPSERVVLLHRR